MKSEDLKLIVKEKYSQIATQSDDQSKNSCCCNSGCCSPVEYSQFSDSYTDIDGYVPEADLGLGCGIPTESAGIREGDTIVDLGSGAGNDCFVARSLAGESGKVIGIDMTEAMVEKARQNAAKLGYSNVEFLPGDIENLPLENNLADVVISNCVLNLVPDKIKAFSEIYRVLKPGGHVSVSDVVLRGELPGKIREAAEMYAGCVSGAVQLVEYLSIIENSGFKNIRINKEKLITIPREILLKYLNDDETKLFINSGSGIYSITVYAEKPALKQ